MNAHEAYEAMVKAYELEAQDEIADAIKDRVYFTWRKWARHNGWIDQDPEKRTRYVVKDAQALEAAIIQFERGVSEYGPQYLPIFVGLFKINGDPPTSPADKIVHRGKQIVKHPKRKGWDW